MKIKIYVGCALTGSPQEFRDMVEEVKNRLRSSDVYIYDFLGLEKGTAKDVYQRDIKECVAECDMFVGICEYQSIGLGYEMATVLEKHDKPVLALRRKDKPLTRLLQGIDHPKYELKEYSSIDEIVSLVKEKIEQLT